MRQIKFRAWHKVEKRMYLPEELFGDLRDEIVISLNGDAFFLFEESNGDYALSTISYRRANIELMEFTGLLDKNSNECFESDIVKVYHGGSADMFSIGQVIFNRGCFMVQWIDDPEANMDLLGFEAKYGRPTVFEVIGNIHSNPELNSQ